MLEDRSIEGCPPASEYDIDTCEGWMLPGVCLECWKEFYKELAHNRNMEIATKVVIGMRKWEEWKRGKDRREYRRVRLSDG